jgi:hypothetical protein
MCAQAGHATLPLPASKGRNALGAAPDRLHTRLPNLPQIIAALYALSLLLRLQVLWGPQSVLIEGGFYTTLFCRVFTAATYGLLEPAYLLLGLFACLYSIQVAAL